MAYVFRPHDPPGICDRCGYKVHLSELRREWNGLMTCFGGTTNNCWEPRNPQDFVRGVPERPLLNAKPEPADVFVEPAAQQASDL